MQHLSPMDVQGAISNWTDNITDVLVDSTGLSTDVMTAYNTYLYLMMILGVPGNLVVMIVYTQHRPATTTDWFIVFITVFDFLSSSVHVPVYVTFTNGVWRSYGTDLICKLHMFVSQSIVLTSSFLICGLAIDRYFKVCRPYSNALTPKLARDYCCAICIVTIGVSVPSAFLYGNISGECTTRVSKSLVVYYFIVFLLFVLVTLIVIFAYIKVITAIRHCERNVLRHQHASPSRSDEEEIPTGRANCCTIFARRAVKIAPVSASFSEFNKTGNSKRIHRLRTIDPALLQARVFMCRIKHTSLPTATSFPKCNSRTVQHGHVLDALTERRRMATSLRITKIAFLVCSIFVITWLPPWVVLFMAASQGMSKSPTYIRFKLFGKMTYLLNTVTNPILYTWLNVTFRKRAKTIFCTKWMGLHAFCKSRNK